MLINTRARQAACFNFADCLRFPFVQQIDAQTAAASITTYGEALFTQVWEFL
ncbi:MAG TPA: hypothetical protein VF844_01240 [Ktedonobacteraceae bacterium]